MKLKTLALFLFSALPILCMANGIDDIIHNISSNNLELKASQEETKAQELEIKSTNNLANPEFDFEYLFGQNGLGDKWGFGVSQSFEWPGIYSARSKANKSQITALGYLLVQRKLEISLEIKGICIDIININKLISLNKELYNNILEIKKGYDKGFKNGDISILDINKLKLECISISQELKDLDRRRNVLFESLKALNGNIDIDEPLLNSLNNYPSYSLLPLQEYLNKIDTFDPQQSYQRSANEIANNQFKVSKMQWFPSISIGYKYSNELGEKFNGITAGISIPIFANRNKVSSAKARMIANEYASKNIIVNKHSDAYSNYSQLQSLKEQIDEYSVVLNDDSNIAVLNKALAGGQISLLNYLTEVQYFINANKQLIELEYQYNKTLSSLDRYSLLTD
ncbi:MAG: TolC family protein [Muribaculaceae bacterium]|nr:TolC family protein [Muribaculaceae bacterium]